MPIVLAHRIACAVTLLGLLSCASAPGRPRSSEWAASVDLGFAARTYDGSSFGSIDEAGAMTLGFAARPNRSAFGGELGLVGSVGGAVGEIYAGPRMTLADPGPGLRPYLGAGVTVLRAELDRLDDAVVSPTTDTAVGGYAHGGVYYEFETGVTFGVDARGVLGTSLDEGGYSGDADYVQFGLTFGSAF